MNEELSSIESFADVDDLKDLIAKAEDILGGIKTLAAELEKAADKAKQKKAVAKREDEVNDFLSGAADLLGVASPRGQPGLGSLPPTAGVTATDGGEQGRDSQVRLDFYDET